MGGKRSDRRKRKQFPKIKGLNEPHFTVPSGSTHGYFKSDKPHMIGIYSQSRAEESAPPVSKSKQPTHYVAYEERRSGRDRRKNDFGLVSRVNRTKETQGRKRIEDK